MKIEWLGRTQMRVPRLRAAEVDVEITVGFESRRIRMSRREAEQTASNLERIAKPSGPGTRVSVAYSGRHVSGYVSDTQAAAIQRLTGSVAQRVVITIDGRTRYDRKVRPDAAAQIIEYARTRA